ncbi:MAG: NERD domain-containing protein [Eubacterium sp.]|nr:NERD domain-containing protein [Eubacterium sp.]
MSDIVLLTIIITTAFILLLLILYGIIQWESPEKRAGRIGEKLITNLIQDVLTNDDFLLTNVPITINEQETELDNLIINSRGIFIIEVKNYRGTLYGSEDDYEWTKIKVTEAGNTYQSTVKNPIKQVKRQVYLLSQYLKEQGIHLWIDGYVFLVGDNSPVKSPYVLHSRNEIDLAIHEGSDKKINGVTKKRLVRLLS